MKAIAYCGIIDLPFSCLPKLLEGPCHDMKDLCKVSCVLAGRLMSHGTVPPVHPSWDASKQKNCGFLHPADSSIGIQTCAAYAYVMQKLSSWDICLIKIGESFTENVGKIRLL